MAHMFFNFQALHKTNIELIKGCYIFLYNRKWPVFVSQVEGDSLFQMVQDDKTRQCLSYEFPPIDSGEKLWILWNCHNNMVYFRLFKHPLECIFIFPRVRFQL